MDTRQGRWEYTTVEVNTNQRQQLNRILNELGCVGWEVVGWASADKTVGFNAFVAVLRRQAGDLPEPADTSPGWKVDPFGRHPVRWWDGVRWTEAVHGEHGELRDVPIGWPEPQPVSV